MITELEQLVEPLDVAKLNELNNNYLFYWKVYLSGKAKVVSKFEYDIYRWSGATETKFYPANIIL